MPILSRKLLLSAPLPYFFCLSALMLVVSTVDAAPLHVMLDPGHGGVDHGAVRGNLRESEIALKVAVELRKLLDADPAFKVSMTRTDDIKIPLNTRTDLAKAARADLFVSIHLNSSTDARAHGREIYFQNQLPADEDALFLANRENSHDNAGEEEASSTKSAAKDDGFSAKSDLKRILEDLDRNERIFSSSVLSKTLLESWELISPSNSLSRGNRSIRQAPFHVVSRNSIPSVLVEIGFISNAVEGPRLADKAVQKSIAASLYEGLIKYSNSKAPDSKTMDNAAGQL